MATVKKETKSKRTYGMIEPSKYAKIVKYAEENGTSYNDIVNTLLDEFIKEKVCKMGETQWSDPIIAADHQLLHVSRIYTGQTVELPHDGTLIRCKIYHIDTGATIAIGQYEDLTIIFKEVSDHGI